MDKSRSDRPFCKRAITASSIEPQWMKAGTVDTEVRAVYFSNRGPNAARWGMRTNPKMTSTGRDVEAKTDHVLLGPSRKNRPIFEATGRTSRAKNGPKIDRPECLTVLARFSPVMAGISHEYHAIM